MTGPAAYNLFFPSLVRKARASQPPARLFTALQLFLDPFDVFEAQLRLDDLHVTDWVYITLNVGDFVVVEGTNNLENPVN